MSARLAWEWVRDLKAVHWLIVVTVTATIWVQSTLYDIRTRITRLEQRVGDRWTYTDSRTLVAFYQRNGRLPNPQELRWIYDDNRRDQPR